MVHWVCYSRIDRNDFVPGGMYTVRASSFSPKTYPSDIIFKLSKLSFTNLLYDKKANKMAITTTIMVELTDMFYRIYKAASIKHFKFYKLYFVVLCNKYMWCIYELEVTNNFILNGCIDFWI